ncbi:receptor-type tyrosine-protein phosphatase mu-like isoform X2 [Tachypleus tridentatus]|uniref:receptor-type tyrosine-protein phosphatase mu-like isoform X2 n=1 Tax=Tachypleus tridentatus TaxID=6853 RepID=UPI003FD23B8D
MGIITSNVIVVFLLFNICGAAEQRADCGSSIYKYHDVCKMNENCSVICPNNCTEEESTKLWGTTVYTYDTPLCLAAIHDLRISSWNTSARTVTVLRQPDTKRYIGSFRQGIKSENYGALGYYYYGSYIFVSPRITEEILDVTSLHKNYLFKDDDSHHQQCHIGTNAVSKTIEFNVFGRTDSNPTDFYRNIRYKNEGRNGRFTMTWPKTLKENFRIGAFSCKPERSMLSTVISLSMREDAHFLPNTYTVTASLGENVDIEFVTQSLRPSDYKVWKKDNEILSSTSRAVRRIEDVEEGYTGMYSLEYQGHSAYRGVVRLIVRGCRHNVYGPSCEFQCPQCHNGGVCHDITGDCICPPGFNGTFCENSCPLNTFGKDCTQKCQAVDSSTWDSCKEILICLPDPFGCTCAPGYKGPKCNTRCSPGEYGAGCSQQRKCNCLGKNDCDIYTGNCLYGCSSGWRGSDCTTSYPVLKNGPFVKRKTGDSLLILFREWTPENDIGSGIPDYYIIEYRSTSNWREAGKLEAKEDYQHNISYKVDGLLPNTQYSLRVLVQDRDGSVQKESLVPETSATTFCAQPTDPPKNVGVLAQNPNEVTVTWKLPDQSTWKCHIVSVKISYNNSKGTFKEENVNQGMNTFSFQSKPYTEWKIALRVETKDNTFSDWTETYTLRTPEGAPSEVQNLSVVPLFPHQLKVVWNKPREENGIIVGYNVRCRQISWVHECYSNLDDDREEIRIRNRSTIIQVNPSAIYLIRVQAETVSKGPWSDTHFQTQEDVPAGRPTKLQVKSRTDTQLRISWDKPKCELTNGRITGFSVIYQGIEDWDSEIRRQSVRYQSLTISALTPYTTYKIMVEAATTVGVSNVSAEVNATTEAADPPSPRNLTVYSSLPYELYIRWMPPYPPKGELKTYRIFYQCRACNSICKKLVCASHVICENPYYEEYHCYTIKKLKPNYKYEIKVKAYNRNLLHGSDWSNTETAETRESVPSAPTNVRVLERGETFITVSWQGPFQSNGNLTKYRLNITATDSFNSDVIGKFRSSEVDVVKNNTHTFIDLYPGSTYELTIEASTRIGFGPPLIEKHTTRVSVPTEPSEPEIINVGDTTVELRLFFVEFHEGPISAYFIGVEKQSSSKRHKRHVRNMMSGYNSSEEGNLYYTTGKFKPEEVQHNFTVGDGKSYGGFFNAPLKTGENYIFGFGVLSNFSGEERYSYKAIGKPITVRKEKPTRSYVATVVAVVFGTFALICGVTVLTLLFILHRMPNSRIARASNSFRLRMLKVKDADPLTISKSCDELEPEIENSIEEKSKRIHISELEEYVQKNLRTCVIREEYKEAPKGQTQQWEIAKKQENRLKNRYGNLMAYDRSRVILEYQKTDQSSDYINASYIDGYERQKEYIATQGPKPNTVVDFWRMVWQEGVTLIAMVTNLIEKGKTKCEKYWPDSTEKYGPVTVTLIKKEVFANFNVQEFLVCSGSETREIKHFHFTMWPDHGVPLYTMSLVSFLKRIRNLKNVSDGPLLVHCSAGVGRTGTLILIDIMMNMAKAEHHVDLLKYMNKLRQNRINMVDTVDQYIFAYQAVVDAVCGEETSISCSDFFSEFQKLKKPDTNTGKTRLQLQFERLEKLTTPLRPTDCREALNLTNRGKNRTLEIVPADRGRPYLKPTTCSNVPGYINAAFVNNCPQYWPENGAITSEGLIVNHVKTDDHNDYIVRSFSVQERKQQGSTTSTTIQQFHLKGWPVSQEVPTNTNSFLCLIDGVKKWQMQSGNHVIIVQCYDGARACGIYCACVFLLDKMEEEKEFDVFLAVRSIRMNRPQLVKGLDQYRYCYDVAANYADVFQIYANFQ